MLNRLRKALPPVNPYAFNAKYTGKAMNDDNQSSKK
jgi:hypothetical protein